jgi:uncharacterized protein YggU (UPF0235/DUF167 family)
MLIELKDNLAKNKEIYFTVRVVTGAPRTELRSLMADGAFKIALAAAPEKGRANKELIAFLAQALGIVPGQLKIVSGAGERCKLLKAWL